MRGKKQAVLDIGSDVLTLALQDGKYNDNLLFKASAEYDGYQDGEFLNPEGLYNALEGLIKKFRDTTFSDIKEIIIGVPSEFTTVVCKTVDTIFAKPRKITQRDIDKIFEQGNTYTNHAEYWPLNCSPVYYILDNGRRTPEAPVGQITKGLASFASYVLGERYFLDTFEIFSQALGVKFLYTSSMLAQLMFAVPVAARDEGIVLVDCGYISTGVAYAKGDGILYSRAFSLGVGNVAGDLTTCLEIPFDHAQELTKKINLNLIPAESDTYSVQLGAETTVYPIADVNEVAACRVQDIAEKIKKVIDASPYEITENTRILITGGGLSIPGSREIVEKVTGRRAEFNSCDAIVNLNKPAHCPLVGLLMYQRAECNKPKIINFKQLFKKLFGNRRNK